MNHLLAKMTWAEVAEAAKARRVVLKWLVPGGAEIAPPPVPAAVDDEREHGRGRFVMGGGRAI